MPRARPGRGTADPGPTLPTDPNGSGSAEGPASGRRLSSGLSPRSPQQTLKPPVRGACSRPASPGPGVQDGEAAVGVMPKAWPLRTGAESNLRDSFR